MTDSFSFEAQRITTAVAACLRNALDLVKSAKLLADAELHAPALSIAVLSMEEVGKIILVDRLIFARPADERTRQFGMGELKHERKLEALDVFPILLKELATLDPRYGQEEAFRLTVDLVIGQYRNERSALAKWLGPECSLVRLNKFKQQGFYVNRISRDSIVSPADAIDKEFAAGVVQLALRLADAISFVLKSNIERFRERVESWRQKITPELLAQIRRRAEAIVSETLESEN